MLLRWVLLIVRTLRNISSISDVSVLVAGFLLVLVSLVFGDVVVGVVVNCRILCETEEDDGEEEDDDDEVGRCLFFSSSVTGVFVVVDELLLLKSDDL